MNDHTVEVHDATVEEMVWEYPDDTYLIVKVQVGGACYDDGFKKDDKVKVVVIKA